MIFKAEINPRDFNGYHEMISHLQTACMRRLGVKFDVTKVVIGQITPNSEMCWFQGQVNDDELCEITRKWFGDKCEYVDTASPGIFTREFIPTEYMTFDGMIRGFQEESIKKLGQGFDETSMRIYRIHPASEMYCIHAHLYKHGIYQGGQKVPNNSLSAMLWLESKRVLSLDGQGNFIRLSDAQAAITRDRKGGFLDSIASNATLTINIKSLGNFQVHSDNENLKKKVTEALLKAINDVQ